MYDLSAVSPCVERNERDMATYIWIQLSLLLRRFVQRLHQSKASNFFSPEQPQTVMFPFIDDVRLCAKEGGRDGHLRSYERNVKAQVVSLEVEAPGRSDGGFAEYVPTHCVGLFSSLKTHEIHAHKL